MASAVPSSVLKVEALGLKLGLGQVHLMSRECTSALYVVRVLVFGLWPPPMSVTTGLIDFLYVHECIS